MSRIIVKNLPNKASEDDVRKHFASGGRITDVKVMRKRDGSSRRFAFVGFTSDAEAEHASKYFNLSFMSSSRLDVSVAKALGDESLEKRKASLKRKRLENEAAGTDDRAKSQRDSKPEPVKGSKDAKLDEYLSVMKPQRATAMWRNDNTERGARNEKGDYAEKLGGKSDDEDVVDLNNLNDTPKDLEDVEMPDEPANPELPADTERGSDEEQESVEDEPDWVPKPTNDTGDSDSEEPKGQAEMSDLDWLRQRQTRIRENGEKPPAAVESNTTEAHTEPEDDAVSEDEGEQTAAKEEQAPTRRLFLRNLAFTVTSNDLRALFAPYGTLKQVHIPIDPKTDKPKGIAFVEFEDVSEAVSAQNALDGNSFQGRLLHIIFAEEQRSYQLDEFDIKNMPLKKQKALKRRMQAAKQQFSWNSLYMNKDTVLEATAAKLGLSKSQILDPTSSNMAVQQALAESSVLESVQSFFRSRGVDLTKFQGRAQDLSDTIILAKNLPYGTSAQEIQDMFAQHGEVVRTLMPPDGGIAIVQFKLASSGRTAFRKLAFRRVGDSILYLQKAPKGVLDDNAPITNEKPVEQVATPVKSTTSAKDMLLPEASQENLGAEVRTSVFIKNLNFETSPDSLTKLFQPLPGFIGAIIKQKPDSRNPGKSLSMGFGFAEFRTLSQAETAVRTLQDTVLDGHSLQLKISSRGASTGESAKAGNVTAKIVIKNIPFETSKKDVVDLFGTFGKLRSVRVPRKFNRQTRGFAFAEFATPAEAQHAMDSLQGAHLLGRRLVMDYAQADTEDPEAEIARMEAKVAQQVGAEDLQGKRLQGQQKGFDMDDLD